MKIEIKDEEIAKVIAEQCYDRAYDEFGKGIYEYGGIYDILKNKISVLVNENKEIIINKAAEIAADKVKKDISVMAILRLLGGTK